MINELIELYPYKTFFVDKKCYIYISTNGALFEVDDKTYNMLNSIHILNNRIVKGYNDESEKFINTINEAGLIKKENDIFDSKDYHESGINAIVILLTQKCNLRCTYCYADGGEYNNKGLMDEEKVYEAIDFLFKSSEQKDLSIMLFGGEPLINFNLFKKSVYYGYKKAYDTNRNLRFSTTTNGTLLTPEIIDFLKKYKISVTISIDGNEDTHNHNRFYSTGEGAYDKTVKHLKQLTDNNKVNARATLTKYNTDVKKIFQDIEKLGFSSIHISPAIELMNAQDYEKLKTSYIDYFNYFKIKIKERDYKTALKMSNPYTLVSRIHEGGIRNKFCGALNNMVASDICGKLYPCHRFVFYDHFIVGSLSTGYSQESVDKIFTDLIVDDNSKCSNCWIKPLCGGGCPQENYVSNGELKSPNNYTCDLLKHNSELAIKLYLELNEDDKNLLFKKE